MKAYGPLFIKDIQIDNKNHLHMSNSINKQAIHLTLTT
jgi:hypothetical protein